MSQIQLLHNDDEVLDPADATLRARGCVLVDGKQSGSWENHRDGTWSAWLHGKIIQINARSRDELQAAIAHHCAS